MKQSNHIEAKPKALTEGNTAPPNEALLGLVLQRIRLRAKRRVAWLRMIWENAATHNGDTLDYHSEVDAYLNGQNTPAAESVWLASEPSMQPLNKEILQVEAAIRQLPNERLLLLEKIFGLSEQESDLVQACLSLSLEPNLGKVYAYLNDQAGRAFVTEELVARLFGHGRSLSLGTDSPVKAWRLVVEKGTGKGEPLLYELDPHIRNWLLGSNELDEVLLLVARFQAGAEPLESWDAQQLVRFISRMSEARANQRLRVFISGPPSSGRRSLAAWVSQQLGLPLLVIDCQVVPASDWHTVHLHAQRQAFLYSSALAWLGDAVFEKGWEQTTPNFFLQFFICEPGQVAAPARGMADFRFEVPALQAQERRALWERLVPTSATWGKSSFENLVLRYQATIGQIAAVGENRAESSSEAMFLLRKAARHHLGSLAQMMECPFTWDDLVIPDWLRSALGSFVYEAEERNAIWENPATRRLFPQGKGLLALFTGPPGTGKTMAAQVIAAELGLDLFRIDMSTVVSKYVGETSKNIERILSRAHRMNAVLLFDEADALFGKRTDVKDAHDRYANTDTNYLLQAIESYPGIALLSSNKKANMDTGFIRRLRYVLEFPKPNAEQRQQLWQRIVGEMAGPQTLEHLNGRLPRLAESVELSGAQIKCSVLSAMYAARREQNEMNIHHLLTGLEQELMKESKNIGKQVREMLR